MYDSLLCEVSTTSYRYLYLAINIFCIYSCYYILTVLRTTVIITLYCCWCTAQKSDSHYQPSFLSLYLGLHLLSRRFSSLFSSSRGIHPPDFSKACLTYQNPLSWGLASLWTANHAVTTRQTRNDQKLHTCCARRDHWYCMDHVHHHIHAPGPFGCSSGMVFWPCKAVIDWCKARGWPFSSV